MTLPDLLTPNEVAQHLKVSRSTVDRLVAQGKLPAPAKFGAIVRFRRDALDAFIRQSESTAPVAARTRKEARP